MCSKVCIAVLFFSTLLFVACEPSVKDGLTYDEYVKMAGEYRNSGDYDRAIAAGKKAVSIKPNDGETHYLLATLYDEGYSKSFDAAQMKALKDAMLNSRKRQYSDPIEEYKKYGLKAEWGPLANQEFKETIKYDPKNWFARYVLATNNFNNKHYREAIDEYKKVIAINPDYPASYSLMGECVFRSNSGTHSAAIQAPVPLQFRPPFRSISGTL